MKERENGRRKKGRKASKGKDRSKDEKVEGMQQRGKKNN
jgi:hypothetical protein